MAKCTDGELKSIPVWQPCGLRELAAASPIPIAWFVAVNAANEGPPEPDPAFVDLARSVTASSRGSFAIEIISCGSLAQSQSLGGGVVHRVLAAATTKRWSDQVSWDLPSALAGFKIVHLFGGFSRSSEFAMLIARQQKKRVCLTHFPSIANSLVSELGLAKLAHIVFQDLPGFVHSGEPIRPSERWAGCAQAGAKIVAAYQSLLGWDKEVAA